MKTPFQEAYEKLIKYEGGYVNDPTDKGGETYKGIARKFHPDWFGWEMIDELKVRPDFPKVLNEAEDRLASLVERFYLDNYWRKIYGDSLPQPIAEELFEQSVNLGVKKAVKHFQTAINILAKGDILDIDGDFGIKTLSAATALLTGVYVRICFNILNILQGEHYVRLMLKRVGYRKYLGWFSRIEIRRI